MTKDINKQIQNILNNPGYYRWMEECNCGAMVRHNNGGNYHNILAVNYENNQWYLRQYDTCELKNQPDWEKVGIKEIREALKEVFSNNYVTM